MRSPADMGTAIQTVRRVGPACLEAWPRASGLPRCGKQRNSPRTRQFQRQRLNHGTHGTHGKEHGGNRGDGGDFPGVTESVSETFASPRDTRMTQRFLSFSVYSVYSVVPHSGLRKDIRTWQRAEVNDPEHWVGESDSVVFAPRKPCPCGAEEREPASDRDHTPSEVLACVRALVLAPTFWRTWRPVNPQSFDPRGSRPGVHPASGPPVRGTHSLRACDPGG